MSQTYSQCWFSLPCRFQDRAAKSLGALFRRTSGRHRLMPLSGGDRSRYFNKQRPGDHRWQRLQGEDLGAHRVINIPLTIILYVVCTLDRRTRHFLSLQSILQMSRLCSLAGVLLKGPSAPRLTSVLRSMIYLHVTLKTIQTPSPINLIAIDNTETNVYVACDN